MLNFVRFFVFSICIFSLTACEVGKPQIAIIDVNGIISQGVHAKQAQEQLAKAQQIFQHNLNVIEKKLSTYTNKNQAALYLLEAKNQLQKQLDASNILTSQALLNTLSQVIEKEKEKYGLILRKENIIYQNEKNNIATDITSQIQSIYNQATVNFPPLPQVIDEPNLPADQPVEESKEEKDKKDDNKKDEAKKDEKNKK